VRNAFEARIMADQASLPTDVAGETGDDVATSGTVDQSVGGDGDEPSASATAIVADAGETGMNADDNLLGELARAMHAAATSQYQRMNAELERRRAEQVEAIGARFEAEIESLKADSETDIGSIELWAKGEIEKIKLERLRRIDARREELSGQLGRHDTIKEREIFAIEVAIDAHRNEVDQFFGRMERETDPAAIAQVASSMPPFPALDDVAADARRAAVAEFAAIDRPEVNTTPEPAGVEPAEAIETDATSAERARAEGTEESQATAPETPSEVQGITIAPESRLKAVMDPGAASEADSTQPWEAPYAVSVAAGTGAAEEEPAPARVGSTLLRTVRSIRPMARHDKDSDAGEPH
jgi:hypothetical protein